MSDPAIVGALILAAGTLVAGVLQYRTSKGSTAVTGYAALTKDLQTERTNSRAEIERLDAEIDRLEAVERLLLAQLAEARAEVAQLRAERAASCAADLVIDNAIGETRDEG